MALSRHATVLPLLLGIAPGGCGTNCEDTPNCGGTVDLLNACSGGAGCDVDGQSVQCSQKAAYPGGPLGYCQVENIEREKTLTIELRGLDLGRRNDVVFSHGNGLRREDGQDFLGAEVMVDGADVSCSVEIHQVTCRDLPATALTLRLRSSRRDLRFVTLTAGDADCVVTESCPR